MRTEAHESGGHTLDMLARHSPPHGGYDQGLPDSTEPGSLRTSAKWGAAIADELNGRLRQTLGFKTPSQALAEVLLDRLSPHPWGRHTAGCEGWTRCTLVACPTASHADERPP
jgi:hypothetical protein